MGAVTEHNDQMNGSRTDYIQSHYEFVNLMDFFSLYQKIFQKKAHELAKTESKLAEKKTSRAHGGFDLKYNTFTGEDGGVKESSCNWKFWEDKQA